MMEEDQTIELHRDEETRDFILSGMGQQHIEIIVEKLKRKYGAEVVLKAPKVPYKETIRGSASAQGRLKKQTGGRGQFGDTWIKVEPLPHGAGFRIRRPNRRRRDPAQLYSRRWKRACEKRWRPAIWPAIRWSTCA